MPDGIDYGPLTGLIGDWAGEDGLDVSPEPDQSAENPYFESLIFEAIGDVENAEEQELACLRYHQVVTRKRGPKVFHNETGYLTWHSETGQIQQTLTIPRGVALVAWGHAEETDSGYKLIWNEAEIAQSPFMREKAATLDFMHEITVEGDALKYTEAMTIDIYGKTYRHTDENTLRRVG